MGAHGRGTSSLGGPKGLPRRGSTHLASPLVLDHALSCVALSNSGSFRVISKISVWGPLISLRGQRLSSVTHALSIWISWIKRSRHRHGRSVQECWPRLSPSPTREMEVQEQILHAPQSSSAEQKPDEQCVTPQDRGWPCGPVSWSLLPPYQQRGVTSHWYQMPPARSAQACGRDDTPSPGSSRGSSLLLMACPSPLVSGRLEGWASRPRTQACLWRQPRRAPALVPTAGCWAS